MKTRRTTDITGVLGGVWRVCVSPGVHLQPGLQLAGLGGVDSRQDVAALDVDDLHRQVAHLTALIQRLNEGQRSTQSLLRYITAP